MIVAKIHQTKSSFCKPFIEYWKERDKSWQGILLETIAILLMGLFLLTAIDKTVRFVRFYDELGKSPFLMAYAGAVAVGTPFIEGMVVWMLGNDQWRLRGLYSSVFLMSLFTAYIYVLTQYSYYTPCLCSAAIESLTWEEHLIFNIVFLVLAIAGVVLKELKILKQKSLKTILS